MKSVLTFIRKHYVIIALICILLIATVIRLYNLSGVPVSLNQDEAVNGYDAYSLLVSGADHHGIFLPLLLQSFGDWVSPLLTYVTIPSVAIFGLTEFSVRLPVAVVGISSILICYLLVEKLTQKKEIALLSALLLSVMPWHIIMSRFAVPEILVVFFGLLMFYFVVCFWQAEANTRYKYLAGIILSAVAMTYSYPIEKLFAPLIILAFVLITWGATWKKNWKKILTTLIAFAILILPQVAPFILQPAKYNSRFAEISILSIQNPNPFTVTERFVTNYAGYLSPEFLFSNNSDPSLNFKVKEFGANYEWLAIPFYAGLIMMVFAVYKRKQTDPTQRRIYLFLLVWLILAPIPASLTADPKVIGRNPQYLLIVIIFVAVFLTFLQKNLSVINYKIALVLLACLTIYYGIFFNYYYQTVYPAESKIAYQYGERQVFNYLLAHETDFDRVDIDTDINQPSIYYLFFSKLDPRQIEQTTLNTQIGKYHFLKLNSSDTVGGELLLKVEDDKMIYLEIYQQPNKVWQVILLNRLKNTDFSPYGDSLSNPN